MSHVHHYMVDRDGVGRCKWTRCPQHTRQFQNRMLDLRDQQVVTFNSSLWQRAPIPKRTYEDHE